MARKVLALRRADSCSDCGTGLPAGTRAEWDPAARVVTCLLCTEARARIAGGAPPMTSRHDETSTTEVPEPAPEGGTAEIDAGEAGASARKEHQRRQAKRAAALEARWGTGRVGRIAKALSDDPPSTTAWAQGAVGEERVAKELAGCLGDRAVLLHDRKLPRTRGNIDHLVVAASGVWIVDAKRYRGKVERRDVGGWTTTDLRLYVGGRDRTELVEGLRWQHDAVVTALGGTEIPVHRALSFVDADWPLLSTKPLRLQDVWISSPRKLAGLIDQPGPLDAGSNETAARLLAERLPSNR